MYKRYLKIGLVYFMDQVKLKDLDYPDLVRARSEPIESNVFVDPVLRKLNELMIKLGDRLGAEHGVYAVFTYANSANYVDLPVQYVFDIHATDGLLSYIVDSDQRWQLFKVPAGWADKPDLIEEHFYNALLTLIGVAADDGTVENTPEDL